MLWNTQTAQLWEAKVKNHPLEERKVANEFIELANWQESGIRCQGIVGVFDVNRFVEKSEVGFLSRV